MDITSLNFIVLTIISVFVFYLLKPGWRIPFLIIISLAFITTYNYLLPGYVILFASINYILGLYIPTSKHKPLLFRLGMVFNLAQLVILKYASFAIDPVLHLFNEEAYVSKIAEILIPVGVSYFTLQGIGYLVNVKMNWEKPERNFLKFLLYVGFFPKFISGPIERSNNFLPQLENLNHYNRTNITEGFRLILNGLVRKVVIANQLSLIVNPVYSDVSSANSLILILVIIVQPLYIYFDFSGYTNIALGIAKSFGINLLPNFNRPLFSGNITIFWRRFHMSLSFWFNDYVFKQASFRFRKLKQMASVIALFITWTLFGIWHGAGWNYMVLGFIFAIAIIWEFFTKKFRNNLFSKLKPFWAKWLSRIITYIFFGCALVFFFSPDLKTTFLFFGRLGSSSISVPFTTAPVIIADKLSFFVASGLLILLMSMEFLSCDYEELYDKIWLNIWSRSDFGIKMLRLCIYYFAILLFFYFGGTQLEFVYFQF